MDGSATNQGGTPYATGGNVINKHDGTLLKCSCCNREVMAGANVAQAQVEVGDRRHGTYHNLTVSLGDLVKMLDPGGTSFVPVGSAR